MAQDRFPYQAVIFDMDGVIVDTERFYFDQEGYLEDGKALYETGKLMISIFSVSFMDAPFALDLNPLIKSRHFDTTCVDVYKRQP